MNYVVLDIETKNIFQDVGSNNPVDLDLSVISIYDSRNKKVQSFLEEDLVKMWPILEAADFIVTFNGDHFDLPLLNKYYRGNLLSMKSVDIMKAVKESCGKRIKLDSIAQATLGKNKLAEGLMAVKWWKEGKIDLIKKYCEEDVMITKQIFDFILEKEYILIPDLIKKEEKIKIPIDTKKWNLYTEKTLSLF
jgi:DEAD/DEAH box helicase domain-containing protein